MPAYPIIVLLASLLLLGCYGAGIFPWTVMAVAVALPACLRPWTARWNAGIMHSPYALLLAYLLLMLLPMSAGVSVISGAERARQNQLATGMLEEVAAAGMETGAVHLFSTTRSRPGTLRFLLLAVPVAAAFRIIVSATARQRDLWLRALLCAATAAGVAGILGRWVFPQGDTLFWIIPVPHGLPGPMGGFMNRNHFAGFCAMLAPAAAALAAEDIRRRRWPAAIPDLAAAATLSLGVFLSLSRGGIAAWCAGVAAFMLTLLRRGGVAVLAPTAAAVVLIAGLALRHDAVRERVFSLRNPVAEASLQDRLGAWRDSLRIWRRYPLLGAGPNAFRSVYPQHRVSSARESRDFAENEYVQWLAEAGLAGTLILALFFARLLPRVRRALCSATEAHSAAAVSALAAAAVHALADFPLHLPFYAITLAAMTGMLWPPGDAPPRNTASATVSDAWVGATGLAAALLLLCVDTRLDTAGRIAGAGLPDTARALAGAPTSPLAWRRLAALLWMENAPPARALAERCLTQAATYDPNNYPLWRRLGDMRRDLGDSRGAAEAYRRVTELRAWVKVPTLPPEDH